MDIADHVALVTGGASGLGAATAELLAARGARVAILDIDAEAGAGMADRIGGLFVRTDIRDEGSAAEALATVEARWGVARILVNCAGIAPLLPTVDAALAPHPLTDFRHVIEVNLIGTFNMLARFSARLARAQPVGEERGVIVNTASIAAFDGLAGQAAYAASKSGIVGLALPVARDLAAHAIRVVTIAPGVFRTAIVEALPDAVQTALEAQTLHPRRLGRPAEFAELVATVIASPMLNAEVIRFDGGHRLTPA